MSIWKPRVEENMLAPSANFVTKIINKHGLGCPGSHSKKGNITGKKLCFALWKKIINTQILTAFYFLFPRCFKILLVQARLALVGGWGKKQVHTAGKLSPSMSLSEEEITYFGT